MDKVPRFQRRKRALRRSVILKAAVAIGALASATAAGAQQTAPAETRSEEAQDSDAPIISDAEFEAELPSLDPAMDAPLEPIEAFPMPAVPPAGAETVADAPLPPDPALTEPLPPLATFDVTPPPAATDPDEEAPPVRYALEIEGLEEVGLQGRFRELSALEDGDGEASNGAQVAARVREDEQLLVRLLRSEGYYDGTGAINVEQVPEQAGQLRVTVTAVPGDRYRLDEIAIAGPETVPPGLPREALALKAGDPIVAVDIVAAEAAVPLRLTQQGYPFPEIGTRDILLDPETDTGDYTLPVEPGPRASFAGFTTEGDLAFGAEHVGVLARFERGQLYDSRLVDDLREAMVATNLFASVSAEPVRTGETAPDGTEYVNILVRQDAGPARTLAANAGFSTGQGLRLEGSWEHRNLFPPEGALRVAGVVGTQEQSLGATFRRSNAGKRDRTVLVLAEAARRDYDAYEAFTATLSGRISRESTPIWQKKWTWSYGAELVATNENRFSFDLGRRERATFFIGAIPLQLGYDASNSLLNPTQGFRITGRISPEASLENGTGFYSRNLIDGSAYYPVAEDIVLAGRVRFGSINGIARDELAPSRRYYGGGGGSVRGYGYQNLGPRVTIANPNFDPEEPDKAPPTISIPIGGRSLNEFSLEGRYRFGDYGVVAFVDAGQVYESQFPRLSGLRYGVGVGGRLYTNFGPLRVDVATPLGRRKGEPWVALYVSIGQAF
jgi:translocation and assembly module TamA